MHNFPFSPYTSGWFQVGWSGEYTSGDVRPLRYFGQDLVCYRTMTGGLMIADAYCPHLGAHLGFGATVEDDCLVCPFHGWRWGPDGRNAGIPYSRPRSMKLQVRHWPVREIDGLVLVWYGKDREEPSWEPDRFVADGGSLEDDFWPLYPECTETWRNQRFPPHASTENACDAAHFRYVHRSAEVPEVVDYSADDHRFRVTFKMRFGGHRATTWATPEGPVQGSMTVTAHGLGYARGEIKSYDHTFTLSATTPVDEFVSDHRCTVWVPRKRGNGADLDEAIRDRWTRQQKIQHAADLPIWENMAYIGNPPYVFDEVGIFRAFRKWAMPHYEDVPVDESLARL